MIIVSDGAGSAFIVPFVDVDCIDVFGFFFGSDVEDVIIRVGCEWGVGVIDAISIILFIAAIIIDAAIIIVAAIKIFVLCVWRFWCMFV